MNKRFTYIFTLMLLVISGAAKAQDTHVVIGGSVYGGGNKAMVEGSCTVLVNQKDAEIGVDVYGGGALAKVNTADGSNHHAGTTTQVTITQGTVNGNVYGGGYGQLEPAVEADVFGPVTVTVNGGTATNVFGCNNYKGAPKQTVSVNVSSGTVTQEVYGGGKLANASASPVVNITGGTVGTPGDSNTGNVYGGGALADVGGSTVNVTGGNVIGNVYGGGLGRKEGENVTAVAAAVNGEVTVNIGAAPESPSTEYTGEATINGSVFGCNNTNGSPTGNVTVNIYKTARTEKQEADYISNDREYALSQVFGGGNQANYEPAADKKATVHVWTCGNTIEYVYGGGNAADLGTSSFNSATDVIIDGGRIEWVFGGGNGYSATNNHTNSAAANYNPGANINGDTQVDYHAGRITYIFGGSNQWGNVTGSKTVNIWAEKEGTCETKYIAELYGGSNEAPTSGNISFNMGCQTGVDPDFTIGSLFGGSKNADVGTSDHPAHITLTVAGGKYTNVFGGNNEGGTIYGNVTLNLLGGTMVNAFGGNNEGGSIKGVITVNMLDLEDDNCPLVVNNIYGGGKDAAYSPDTPGAYPVVNLIHGTVSKNGDVAGNVFGGGYGATATVTSNPMVNVGYQTSMSELATELKGSAFTTSTVVVAGDVYGGGELAPVSGNTTVTLQQVTSGVSASTTVSGDVYGGGALANTGNTIVTLEGGTVSNVYGGGLGDDDHAAAVGNTSVTVNGGNVTDVFGCNNVNGAPSGTVTVNINNNVGHDVFGGGNLAQYTGNPVVNINHGTVTHNVYGGGKGVLASGANRGQKGKVTGNPQVTIGDDNNEHTAHVTGDVYGGGDAAHVVGTPVVEVNDCNTTIGYLYGGGNAADVSGTNITFNAGTVTNQAFGGGHGDKNVTVEPLKYADVNGSVTFNVYGGTIAQVFAGSNSKGSITGTSALTVNKTGSCAMKIGEVYGGGNEAAGNAGTINIRCTGNWTTEGPNNHTNHNNTTNRIGYELEGVGTVYGGANRADIGTSESSSDITLNIVSGIVENVFGGNNTSGVIYGNITVNITQDESATCLDHWYVGNVYGGGNQADYSRTPQVNILKGTVSGNVYGGGNNITDGTKGVAGSNVEMTGGSVLGGVYGGCNEKGSVTGKSLVKIYGGTVGSSSGNRADVFGGGLGQYTMVNGDVEVIVNKTGSNETHIYGDVYGGSAKGKVNCTSAGTASGAKTDVTLTLGTIYGNLYGGGLGVTNGAAADVWGPVTVTVNGGLVSTYNSETAGGNVYGCNNYNGAPQVSTSVVISGGTVAHDVFGGGNLANASIATHVTVDGGTVSRDVYGGGALANTGATTVDIKSGTVTRNIYGGGLGDLSHSPTENGEVIVNIGWPKGATSGSSASTEHNGTATIGGNVYGSNNTAGSPQQNVTVNVYGTAHTEDNSLSGTGYAIANVFGGGNKANYTATGKKAMVNIFGCFNTIGRVFGGGDAAATPSVETDIQGGRINMVFGGGNGEGGAPGANVNGTVNLNIHGGQVGEFYGGSNQYGTISGDITTNVDSDGPCESLTINEFFCGGNFVDITSSLTTTIECSDNMNVASLYGGCNQASISGDVVLNVYGGIYDTIFGGSKGRLPGTNDPADPGKEANITGNVTLNLYGGTAKNVFGGSNVLGNILGNITVNVLDVESNTCPLYITNLYGGSNLTDYAPTSASAISPVVNVVHALHGISGNVYGGSKGKEGITTTVTANPRVNIGYNADMNGYITPTSDYLTDHSDKLVTPRTNIAGSVYGGGDAAQVTGNTAIFLRNRSKVMGNVYGGGNMEEVTGNTKVIVDGVNH